MSDFGHWLAGFIDGEGCFYITSAGSARPGVWKPKFSLTLRADDRPTLEAARRELIGIGRIHEYEPSGPGRRVVRWMVQSQADCQILCATLDIHPLRSKKRRDFDIWSRAVTAAAKLRRGHGNEAANASIYETIKVCKDEIAKVREYE